MSFWSEVMKLFLLLLLQSIPLREMMDWFSTDPNFFQILKQNNLPRSIDEDPLFHFVDISLLFCFFGQIEVEKRNLRNFSSEFDWLEKKRNLLGLTHWPKSVFYYFFAKLQHKISLKNHHLAKSETWPLLAIFRAILLT